MQVLPRPLPHISNEEESLREMQESILNKKRILIVDDEPDVLEVLREEIQSDAPDCDLDTATSYEEAIELLVSWTYDLAILDIMGVRGFDLLQNAISRPHPIPVVMLTGAVFSPESLKNQSSWGPRLSPQAVPWGSGSLPKGCLDLRIRTCLEAHPQEHGERLQ